MKNSNPDVPLEAVVKYLVKERDEANAKLEQLVGYTKSLEVRVKEMEAERESGYQKALAVAMKERDEKITRCRKALKKLIGQQKCLVTNFDNIHSMLC